MRAIKYIVLHCTATPQNASVQGILNYWRNVLGWKNPGYHFIIKPNGEVVNLLPIEQVSNGVAGYNSNSIHISYIGGVNVSGQPMDNRTPAQIVTQIKLIKQFKAQFPNAEVKGHRDFPKVQKACPSFDVASWLKKVGLENNMKLLPIILLSFVLLSCGTRKKTITTSLQEFGYADKVVQHNSQTELQTSHYGDVLKGSFGVDTNDLDSGVFESKGIKLKFNIASKNGKPVIGFTAEAKPVMETRVLVSEQQNQQSKTLVSTSKNNEQNIVKNKLSMWVYLLLVIVVAILLTVLLKPFKK